MRRLALKKPGFFNYRTAMKSFPIIMLAVSCGLSSCDKARELAGRFNKKPAAEAPATTASGPLVTTIAQDGYDSFRQQRGKVVVIDFYADWCGPCQKLGPILEKIAGEHGGKILIGKVNVDQNRELASREKVQGIPDVRIFRDGAEVDRFVGLPDESEVRLRLETHTRGLPETGEAKPATPQPSAPQPMSKDWLPPGMQRR
jgi:thioredoxin